VLARSRTHNEHFHLAVARLAIEPALQGWSGFPRP
jgi:hypothetical protein